MIRITFDAANQIDGLLAFYLEDIDPPRPDAAMALLVELAEAQKRIEMDPSRGRSYPATYVGMQRFGFLWLRVRAYWISWAALPRGPVVTNVFHAAADIEHRASPDIASVREW